MTHAGWGSAGQGLAGQGLAGVETPALVVDLDALEANLASMAAAAAARSVRLRPHAKTHKCAAIARRQLAAGASGLTVATIGEAEHFASQGMRDLFIAYPLLARGTKGGRLAQLCARAQLRIGIDSRAAADAVATALSGTRGRLEVLVELDCGQHRSGVRPEAAGELARDCRRLGLAVAGAFTHGGHVYAAPGAAAAAAADEDEALRVAGESLASAGVEVHELSAGSTPTARLSGSHVSEERPGSYVFSDRQQLALGGSGEREVALHVLASVVSTAVPGQAVIDAGSKALASDRPAWLDGHGAVVELGGAVVSRISEHHGVVTLAEGDPPAHGTVVRVVPNHACNVVNLFDRYVVERSGEVLGSWPIGARGLLS